MQGNEWDKELRNLKKANQLRRKNLKESLGRKRMKEKLNKVQFTPIKKKENVWKRKWKDYLAEVRKIKKIFLIMFRGVWGFCGGRGEERKVNGLRLKKFRKSRILNDENWQDNVWDKNLQIEDASPPLPSVDYIVRWGKPTLAWVYR